MIHYVTSTHCNKHLLLQHAKQVAIELRPFESVILSLSTVPHAYEADQGEDLLRRHVVEAQRGIAAGPGRIVIAVSIAELPLLRLLRHVRSGCSLRPTDLVVHVLDRHARPTVLCVNEDGEFKTRWPHGFFEARATELFDDACPCEDERRR